MAKPPSFRVRIAAGFLVGVCCAIAATATETAGVEFHFEQISLEKGLSQSTVTSIIQDRRGFLWIGTDHGLNRYDGRSIMVYLPDPGDRFSIGGPRIRCLEEAPTGMIWIGTFESGLSVFNPISGRFEVIRHDGSNPASLSSDRVTALTTDGEGRLWVGTAEGLDRLEPDGRSFDHIELDGKSDAGRAIHALLKDERGRLWIGTGDGLFSIDTTETGMNVLRHDLIGDVRDAVPVTALAGAGGGAIWVGTDIGLVRLEPGAEPRWWRPDSDDSDALPGEIIASLIVDHLRRLWVGTTDRGLCRLNATGDRFIRFPVSEDDSEGVHGSEISSLFEDRSQILWIGTDFGGLDKLDLKGRHFRLLDQEDGLPSRTILSVSTDHRDRLWIGTRHGVVEYDRHTGTTTLTADRPGCEALRRGAYSFLEVDDGRTMLVGTWISGVIEVDLQGNTCRQRLFDPDGQAEIGANTVVALLEDSRGRRWFGTWDGLIRTDGDGGGEVRFPVDPGHPDRLQSALILALTETEDGSIWVGTDGGGLSRYNEEGGGFETFRHSEADGSISSDSVAWITEGPDGNLWVGTAAGLNRLDRRTGSFTTYGLQEGLPSDAITAVQVDDHGRVWVAHFGGLSLLIPERDEVVTFDVSDGVGAREFNRGATARDSTGRLFFGGIEGLVYFEPERVERNPHPPVPLVTTVRVFDQLVSAPGAVEAPSSIKLNHRQNFLTFSFAGLEFTAPARNRLSYRLIGADRTWVKAGDRRDVSYGHLRPGRYTFQVRAANNHGVTSDRPDEVTILIAPPFWQTLWFRIGLIVVLSAFLAAVFWWRTRALRQRLFDQERLVKERTSQLAEANLRLQELTITDPLTGVANRRRLDQVLEHEWRRAGRFRRMIAVVVADIDDFKAYNDTLGHTTGDHCLREVANALSGVVNRPGDLLARFGGEEFLAVFAETNAEAAFRLAERMRAAVEELAIPHPGTRTRVVTVSVGVAVTVPAADQAVESLIEAADAAMYEAKSAGKNRVGVGRL